MKITEFDNLGGQFYNLAHILKKNADYNMIFGERSNGKTYAALEYGVKEYVAGRGQMAYIRRWQEDIIGKRAETLFSNLVANGAIERITNGKYTDVFYWRGQYFLCSYDDKGKKKPSANPFCYAFALSNVEHDKSTSYPFVNTIIFDEFLTRKYYLPDEFITFMNVLSTIIRKRTTPKIFMLGNTVNKYCPYFAEMGLKHVLEMQQGDIDVYSYGKNDEMTVAVEYAPTVSDKNGASNKYFCFDNPNLKMITGGKWELSLYPHLTKEMKFIPKDIVFTYFIVFGDNLLQCEVVQRGTMDFTYIHRKTTPLKDDSKDLIYSLQENGKANYRKLLPSQATNIDRKIARYFATQKVFFQDNDVGEVVRNYIRTSLTSNPIGAKAY